MSVEGAAVVPVLVVSSSEYLQVQFCASVYLFSVSHVSITSTKTVYNTFNLYNQYIVVLMDIRVKSPIIVMQQ